MTDNFYKSEIDRELLLNIEIQKQNLKALPDKFKAQKKVVSPVTQQMIDDYKKQFRDLYKRGTGDTSQFFKFLIPGAVPEILKIDDELKKKLIDNGTLKKELTIEEFKKKNKELDALIDTYMEIENETIQDEYDNINKSREEINNLSSLIKQQKTNKLNPKRLITITELENEIKKSQDNINKLKIDNGNNTTKANELKKELEENDENILFNEKYLYTLEQNDKKKRDEYAETLKRMNDGQIDVTRGQFESEEDYFKRLSDVALIEEDLTIVHLFNNNEFKKNLKPIVQSEWKIENISKAFTNDDKFLLNKTIAGFKKYFKENVGIGNKNLEVDEYIALITGYLDSEGVKFIKGVSQDKKETKEDDTKTFSSAFTKKEEETKEEETKEDDEEDDDGIDYDDIFGYNIKIPDPVTVTGSVIPEVKATKINKKDIKTPLNELSFKNIKLSKEDDILKVSNNVKDEELYTLYFKLMPPSSKSGTGANEIITYSYDGINYYESRKGQQFNTDLNFYLSQIGINDNDRKVFLYMIDNNRSINNYSDKVDNNTKITPTKFITFFKSFKSGSGLRKSKRKKIIAQKGASVKQVGKFVEFGNLILLLRKLYDNNVLSIKDKNGINIPGIPNQKTNDNFVNLILKIVNNEDVNLKDIDDLNEKDSILFTVLMNKAGLKKKYQINNVRTLEALSKRLELLEGEFEAGNDNDIMIKELYEIVFKLAYLGAITLSNAKKHYKQTVKLLKKN